MCKCKTVAILNPVMYYSLYAMLHFSGSVEMFHLGKGSAAIESGLCFAQQNVCGMHENWQDACFRYGSCVFFL